MKNIQSYDEFVNEALRLQGKEIPDKLEIIYKLTNMESFMSAEKLSMRDSRSTRNENNSYLMKKYTLAQLIKIYEKFDKNRTVNPSKFKFLKELYDGNDYYKTPAQVSINYRPRLTTEVTRI